MKTAILTVVVSVLLFACGNSAPASAPAGAAPDASAAPDAAKPADAGALTPDKK